jgi:hypothetical protein
MRLHFLTPSVVLAGLGTLLLIQSPARTQPAPPPPPAPPAASDQYEVLTRGPVHEAYAEPVDYNPEPGPVADKAPPAPIDELPPDQKPEGNDIEWIPGYWAWDGEGKDYLWVSGFWRDMPPGRQWVPGTWQEAADGWHWTPGFWADEQQQTIEYVPQPPQSIDAGPSTPAVHETDTWVPGSWIWRETRFFWRPGFWVDFHPDWVWNPAHFVWTPGGCIFVEGYWDHPLNLRGLLFAPILPRVNVAFIYRPSFVIQADFLLTALFVGPARRHYYFGDFSEPAYERRGFVAWINFQPSRRALDPDFAFFRASFHGQPQWTENLTALYQGRRAGDIPRPPRTLVQQNTVINNINNSRTTNVNVTKNINITNLQNVTVVQPLNKMNRTEVTSLASLAPAGAKGTRPAAPQRTVNLAQVNEAQVNQVKERIQQNRTLAKQRQQTEAKLLAEPRPGAGAAERTRPATRLELPKAPSRAGTAPPATKKGEPTAPPARTRPAPPAAPTLPKHVEREAPKREGEPPRTIQPPASRKERPPAKEPERPGGVKERPMPKKEKETEPPAAKSPPPKMREEPPLPKTPAPPPKLKEEPPLPKTPAVPPKKEPPEKKEPPKKKDDGKN